MNSGDFRKILLRIYDHKFVVTKLRRTHDHKFVITMLWRTYDEVMTNLWRFYDHLMIFQKSGPGEIRSILTSVGDARITRPTHNRGAEIARPDIARPDNAAPYCKSGHRETCFSVRVDAHYKFMFWFRKNYMSCSSVVCLFLVLSVSLIDTCGNVWQRLGAL